MSEAPESAREHESVWADTPYMTWGDRAFYLGRGRHCPRVFQSGAERGPAAAPDAGEASMSVADDEPTIGCPGGFMWSNLLLAGHENDRAGAAWGFDQMTAEERAQLQTACERLAGWLAERARLAERGPTAAREGQE